MKIAIITACSLWSAPFVRIYTKYFDDNNIDYDIISWNRDGRDKPEGIQYNFYQPISSSSLKKIIGYLKYAKFVKKTVLNNKYDKLVVFSPQVGIFISSLLKEYRGRYIFDYRDLSIEQKSYFKRPFLKVLKNSFANVISSPGFKKYLPVGFDYILSHNLDVDVVRESLNKDITIRLDSNPIDILTIGAIRDYESNIQVIENLANVDGFMVRFVGNGPSADALEKASQSLNAKNISFEGLYPKEKEKEYVENATFLNIFYPRKTSHDTALSNRFYNSLIYAKPMITTAHTTQGDYAANFKVGVALSNCDNLSTDLQNYLHNMDVSLYKENREKLLQEFLLDYHKWESVVKQFLEM